MNRIIFATGNAGKMKEIREILGAVSYYTSDAADE